MSKLKDKTRHLLVNRPRPVTYTEISAATGLSRKWIADFATDVNPDPGVVKVETLYVFLTGRELDV